MNKGKSFIIFGVPFTHLFLVMRQQWTGINPIMLPFLSSIKYFSSYGLPVGRTLIHLHTVNNKEVTAHALYY